MPTPQEITTFTDAEPPPGVSPWVDGAGPLTGIEVVDPDPAWPQIYAFLDARIREALGDLVVDLAHVGSTAVPGLAAKPVIDIDLLVEQPAAEGSYVPALCSLGFTLVVREPWWSDHRCLRSVDPMANLHVFGPDSPEPVRHRILRDHLRTSADDRDLYAAAKRDAAARANAEGEHVMQYNARKEPVVREIYSRAFAAAGLLGARGGI
ncbi:GrpB family protein [Aeromicrobium sp. CTD01-1L150]|uniref:GrpB family protein n=1 Tax=Aeromicrobium sp. CTD01-1L150 TaxID=3341830 RepID=UPI0035BFF594